jgi:hypothetical protein
MEFSPKEQMGFVQHLSEFSDTGPERRQPWSRPYIFPGEWSMLTYIQALIPYVSIEMPAAGMGG